MNPGNIFEETGQTARSLIDALKGSPVALFMLISNAAILAFLWYVTVENNAAKRLEAAQRAESSKAFAEKMVDCVPSETVKQIMDRSFKVQSDESKPLPKQEKAQ